MVACLKWSSCPWIGGLFIKVYKKGSFQEGDYVLGTSYCKQVHNAFKICKFYKADILKKMLVFCPYWWLQLKKLLVI